MGVRSDRRGERRDGGELGPAGEQGAERAARCDQGEAERGERRAGGEAAPRAGEQLGRGPGAERGGDRGCLHVLAVTDQVGQAGGPPVRRYNRGRREARRRRDPDRDQGLGEDEARTDADDADDARDGVRDEVPG